MADITPGYDFEATETPNAAKLLIQAKGLTIAGLTADDLPIAVASVIDSIESGTTGASLPAEGWMWVDGNNNIWVETRWTRANTDSGATEMRAACYLNRPCEGGWATRRFYDAGLGSGGGTARDEGEPITPLHGGDVEIAHFLDGYLDWIPIQNGPGNPLLTGGGLLGWVDESASSGVRPHVVGRGGAMTRLNQPYPDAHGTQDTYRMQFTTSQTLQWLPTSSNSNVNRIQGQEFGKHWRRGSGSTATGKMTLWVFAQPIIGNQST